MKQPIRKSAAALLVAASACVALSGSAFAFDDVKNQPGAAYILDLKERGVIQGVGNGQFKPAAKLTGASAVSMIVKGLGLSLDDTQFIKKPEASDYYTKIPNNASYAEAFIVAQLNGLDIPRDIDPNADVTREQFAHWLYQAISTRGDYAFTEQYILIADEDEVTPAYSDSLQKLLISGIAELDSDGGFRPQAAISRGDAAVMVDKAIQFVEETKPISSSPESSVLTDIKLETSSFADGVSKVTLSATAPHPGYGIEVSSIVFSGDQAIVNYRVVQPDPAALYAQVITTVQAETYIPASYDASLGTIESSEAASSADEGSAASGSTGFPVSE